ncbi:hypothetical protein [Nocardioides pantholopis]|uniref:hypothetical protein n=1 Tax=Nocardioides pantholopis TaxID=2483798 RepID=UPI0019D132D8|nr:hypothetical protein [Nocardioides pantholopis]
MDQMVVPGAEQDAVGEGLALAFAVECLTSTRLEVLPSSQRLPIAPAPALRHQEGIRHDGRAGARRRAEKGENQPRLWSLRHLSANDISPDGAAMTVPEMREATLSYLRPEDDLTAEAEVLVGRGWLTRHVEQRQRLADAGERAPSTSRMHPHHPEARDPVQARADPGCRGS